MLDVTMDVNVHVRVGMGMGVHQLPTSRLYSGHWRARCTRKTSCGSAATWEAEQATEGLRIERASD